MFDRNAVTCAMVPGLGETTWPGTGNDSQDSAVGGIFVFEFTSLQHDALYRVGSENAAQVLKHRKGRANDEFHAA